MKEKDMIEIVVDGDVFEKKEEFGGLPPILYHCSATSNHTRNHLHDHHF